LTAAIKQDLWTGKATAEGAEGAGPGAGTSARGAASAKGAAPGAARAGTGGGILDSGAVISKGGAATSSDIPQPKVYNLIEGVRPAFGEGRENLSGGGFYEGGFRHGKRAGAGKLVCNAEGTEVYVGQFELEFMHGFGEKRWPDGSVYQGLFHKGRKHGNGMFQEASGRRYDGQWCDGKRHGNGTQRHGSGPELQVYEGRWENGLQHGTGKYTDTKDGTVYEGRWQCGAHHGPGLLRRKDGVREKLRYCHGMLESQEVLPMPTEYLPMSKLSMP